MKTSYETQMIDNNINILGVKIDNLKNKEIESFVNNVLKNSPKQRFVVTLNPEIVLKAHRNRKYRDLLNRADLSLCDGFGLQFAAWLKGKKIERYTGVDLVESLLKLAKKENNSILVVASEESLSSINEIEQGIAEKYGVSARVKYWQGDDIFKNEEALNAEIVFVNFGAPDQEEFISEYKDNFPNAKILAGVGGSFDFLTGRMKRAPGWMRKSGIEWLWRLIQEPKRIKRIINAIFVFPIAVIIKNEK